MSRPASEIAALYKERWEIELVFKWLKQNLKIRRFWGRSENAVRIQIYVALIAFMLLRILHSTAARSCKTGTALLLAQLRIGLFAPLHLAQTAKPPPIAANPETAPSTGRFRARLLRGDRHSRVQRQSAQREPMIPSACNVGRFSAFSCHTGAGRYPLFSRTCG